MKYLHLIFNQKSDSHKPETALTVIILENADHFSHYSKCIFLNLTPYGFKTQVTLKFQTNKKKHPLWPLDLKAHSFVIKFN